MGAPEIIDMLQAPHNAHRALSLALTWPSLAAELADLCYDNDQRPPQPLRAAHQAVRADHQTEGYAAVAFTKGKE